MQQAIQVLTTTDSKDDAQKIARSVVEKRLAGCVQIIGPITSVYRWNGEIETAEEWLCIAKSHDDLYAELEAAIREVHPYDVPEILALPVVQGASSYLDWLNHELKHPESLQM